MPAAQLLASVPLAAPCALMQGRLPIRVELKGLSAHDFYRILTEPQFNLVTQQKVRRRPTHVCLGGILHLCGHLSGAVDTSAGPEPK